MTVLSLIGTGYVGLSAGFIYFKTVTAGVNISQRMKSHKEIILPKVSIIVPVYNENPIDLKKCLFSCLNNNYENKEVVAVNDGSTKYNVLETLYEVKKTFPQLKIINFTENVKKREALYAGIKKTNGEIIICVDSDSIIQDGESIQALVQPFQEERVVAVSGNTQVENEKKNLLTRMQAGRYALAFEIEKAGQASYTSVTCCPGCFSAYRRTAVMEVIEKWRAHTVFGIKTSYGDDRSLTRLVLLNGGKVSYAGDAICRTNVPETIKQFIQQQIRWKKSFASEHYLLAINWKKLTTMAKVELVWFVPVFLLGYLAKAIVMWKVVTGGMTVIDGIALYTMFSTIHYVYVWLRYPGMRGFWGSLYGVLNDMTVEWLFWYSVSTLKDSRWGTR